MLCARTGCCCKPSATPSETLSGWFYRTVQITVTVFLVGVIGASIWGCIVAGPQVLTNFCVGLNELVVCGAWQTSSPLPRWPVFGCPETVSPNPTRDLPTSW